MDKLLPFERIKREILIRQRAKVSGKYGKRPEERNIKEILDYGIINIDKPRGPTSHQVSAYVQKILEINKGGHSGTLDPKVTGVLPVAIGRGTRIVQALLPAGKEYIALMHLHKEVDPELIRQTITTKFIGKIKQLPPVKSAVKRQHRYRKIYYIDILEIDCQDVLMQIGCQAGTYIRKLLHDIGKALGTGAHMQELRRTKAGPFNESTITTLTDLQDAYWFYKNEGNDQWLRKLVQPIEEAVAHLPKIWVLNTSVDTLCHGANLNTPGIVKVESDIQVDELVAIMTLKGELVCIGTSVMISKDMITKDKGLAVKTSKVFMLPGTYPK
ncbi:RNA-guided pseudouridylation complex pseudouridine synthase subunit Cbf5 [Candidatus Woesearchaeota archaeon]|nr:RNA-guided pseudouridylation complex pseudouridine synthase subunit Cbf5 [Candidatus Woesearchaeota archaeon]